MDREADRRPRGTLRPWPSPATGRDRTGATGRWAPCESRSSAPPWAWPGAREAGPRTGWRGGGFPEGAPVYAFAPRLLEWVSWVIPEGAGPRHRLPEPGTLPVTPDAD